MNLIAFYLRKSSSIEITEMEKSKEEIQAERKAKKLAKQAAKGKKVIAETPASNTTAEPVVKEIPQERENQNNNENSPVKSTVPDNLANGDVHILQNGLKGKDGFEVVVDTDHTIIEIPIFHSHVFRNQKNPL